MEPHLKFETFGVDEDIAGPSTSSGVPHSRSLISKFAQNAPTLDRPDSRFSSSNNDYSNNISTTVPLDANENIEVSWHCRRISLPIRPDFLMKVTCVKVISPSLFWLHLQTSAAVQMDNWIKEIDLKPLTDLPSKFEYVLSPWKLSQDELVFRRARVMQSIRMPITDQIVCRVFLIDWAETIWVSFESLREMPQNGNVANIPWQVLCCAIHGLSPKSNIWSKTVCEAFTDYMRGKQLFISPPNTKRTTFGGQKVLEIDNSEFQVAYPVDLMAKQANRSSRINVATKLYLMFKSDLVFNRSAPKVQFKIYDVYESALSEMKNCFVLPDTLEPWQKGVAPFKAPEIPKRRRIMQSDVHVQQKFSSIDIKCDDLDMFMTSGCVSVRICQVVDPWTIFAQPVSPVREEDIVRQEQFEKFAQELDSFYAHNNNRVPIDCNRVSRCMNDRIKMFAITAAPALSQYKYARIVIEDSKFINVQRSEIQLASRNRFSQEDIGVWGVATITVQFIDFGGSEPRMFDEIYQIADNFCALPQYCWRLCLMHLKPHGTGAVQSRQRPIWSDRACKRLVQLLPRDKPLTATVCPFEIGESQMDLDVEFPTAVANLTTFGLWDMEGRRLMEEVEEDDVNSGRVQITTDLIHRELAILAH